ncbi:hypothetical protein LCGC14_2607830, partial [marine sediment metagenome]
MSAQLTCIAVFYLLIFVVGVYAARRYSKDETPQDLLLAGRRVPLLVGIFTLTATWVGGGYINGTAEAVYSPELGLIWAQAPWCYALSLVFGGLFFAGRMRRLGFTTLLDPFEVRYGKQVAAGLFLPAQLSEIFWCAAVLVALGTTFGTILDFDVRTSILISAAVAVGYTALGGLRSVAYTDVLQLLCILIGLGIAVPYVLSWSGGPKAVMHSYVEKMPGFPQGSAVWLWFDTALLLILGGIPWQAYFQRVLASANEKAAVRLSYLAGIGCAVMAVPAVIIGAAGSVVDWSTMPSGPPADAAHILPHVLQHLTPPAVATIGLAAVAAAVMSSADSSILSASSMFVWNVYRPLLRPGASNREMRCVLRVAVVAVGTAGTALALCVQSVYALWYLCADFV